MRASWRGDVSAMKSINDLPQLARMTLVRGSGGRAPTSKRRSAALDRRGHHHPVDQERREDERRDRCGKAGDQRPAVACGKPALRLPCPGREQGDQPQEQRYSEEIHACSPTRRPSAASSTWAAVFERTITARWLARSRTILLVNPPVRPFFMVTVRPWSFCIVQTYPTCCRPTSQRGVSASMPGAELSSSARA